jgi:hypothetical protein
MDSALWRFAFFFRSVNSSTPLKNYFLRFKLRKEKSFEGKNSLNRWRIFFFFFLAKGSAAAAPSMNKK